ncbi:MULTISPECIES: class I SAM-dependent methyltransferase [Clostridia]|uniref:class I SAM-dependent methyltransferase n=1 Tax=Clostridia TaxID=186801 RepID=UPI000EA18D8A|nr:MULTISPECIES: class I SAM-dependent methyltransferase [Clostridia]NBJ71542.1 class I SAM-dependent methyltransferase [Roseburia sp. 1XD42-34]RKI74211.1 class I SAM-dependent methyltransferase [Clostridium sp. 1xD42-85]
MAHDFSNLNNKYTYAERGVNKTWTNFILEKINLKMKRVADIGCGGGIYTKKIAQHGPLSVTGIDSSSRMLEAARSRNNDDKIKYLLGDAENLTSLKDGEFDIVLERALIHHLQSLKNNFIEVKRILNSESGVFIIQDRTPEDCLLEGTPTHIRGYFFEKFPFLAQEEVNRRFSNTTVKRSLADAGFKKISSYKLWEIRSIYNDAQSLKEDLSSRRGRSILHWLNEEQLNELINFIQIKLPQDSEKIIEKDRWTVWIANS